MDGSDTGDGHGCVGIIGDHNDLADVLARDDPYVAMLVTMDDDLDSRSTVGYCCGRACVQWHLCGDRVGVTDNLGIRGAGGR